MITIAQTLANPGLLKLELMRRGVKVAPDVLDEIRPPDFGVTGHALFGSAWDLDIVLPGDTWASVPVHPSVSTRSPFSLVRAGGRWAITADTPNAPETTVRLGPAADFFATRTPSGVPLGQIGTLHGPYLALSPTRACDFLGGDDQCRFCGVAGAGAGAQRDPIPVDDIIEAIRVARRDHAVNMVHLSVGHLGTADGGVRFLEPYVNAIKKHFDVLVAVDGLPPADNGWIDRTYGMGADAVSYNLEIFDPRRFNTICPGPARAIGRERFLEALSYATSVFPSGAVTCHLIVGLEPLESTRAGIDLLTKMGVIPVLPVYRPFKGRDMRADSDVERFDPSLEDLAGLYRDLYRAIRKQKISLALVRDIATVTTPAEGRFFAGDEGFIRGLRHRVAQTRLGRRTSARLSDLRRALRVREVALADSVEK